jgi:quinolinate synthase
MLRLQLPLGERYTDATPGELADRIAAAKATLGDRLFILGHHYQRDEVMEWADARGDSFRLSVLAQEQPQAEYIVFCGVHFMAESADILTGDHQAVILPDLNAGCSMADMADLEEVTEAWETLAATTDISKVIPITYMNSSAALKAFVGEHGGLTEADVKDSTFLLWKGHCSVHQRFRPEHIAAFREANPDGIVVVHPECAHDVCELADQVGSTDYIIRAIENAPVGAVIGVGTEIHLTNRLNNETPDKTVVSLDPLVCPCSTMFRIDGPHLCWVLENLVNGKVVNRITVDPDTTEWAKVALDRMLQIT